MPLLTVWPTDASDGAVTSEARWRKMAKRWLSTCVAAPGDLKPTIAAGVATVAAGAGWIDGHYVELTNAQQVPAAGIGWLVVRFDPAPNTAELMWLADPATPQRVVGGVWDLALMQTTAAGSFDKRQIARNTNTLGGGLLARTYYPANQIIANTGGTFGMAINLTAVIPPDRLIRVEFYAFCMTVTGNTGPSVLDVGILDDTAAQVACTRSTHTASDNPHGCYCKWEGTPLAGTRGWSGYASLPAGNGTGGTLGLPTLPTMMTVTDLGPGTAAQVAINPARDVEPFDVEPHDMEPGESIVPPWLDAIPQLDTP